MPPRSRTTATTPPFGAELRRREFILGGVSLAALALSGCGEDDAAEKAPSTRRFVGAQGPVNVPQRPKRTVAMYPTDTDIALVLGLPIVAAPGATGSAQQPFAAYHAARLKGVERITASFEPNYEQIAAARPDVIIDSALSPGDKKGYQRLSRIAPTVAYEPKDWRDYLRVAATAFGRQQRVEAALQRFDQRAADVRAQLGDRWKGKTFASVFAFPEEVIIAGADAQVHQILKQDLGMRLHPLVAPDSDNRITLAVENLARLDADVLVLPAYPKPDSLERDREAFNALRLQPLWKRLPAVKADQVYEFSGELVYTSPLTAAALLDELADQLV